MTRKVLARDRQGIEMRKTVSPIGILALVLGLIGPIAGHAEIISVPSAAPSSSAASPPPPTVLRGSPSATAIPAPICPPGYTLSPGYGCIKPRGGDDTEGWPGYGYWPEYGLGYPIGGFGHGPGRSHRFARPLGFRGFHGPPGFHRSTRFAGFGTGAQHMGGFGRR